MNAQGEVNAVDRRRRAMLGAVALTLAGPSFATAAKAETAGGSELQPAGPDFGPPKRIDAGVLNVGYVEAGPNDGPVVILLHGWPYDIHSFVDVAPILAGKGYRVIVPYLRGFGDTRFLSADTMRNGEPAALESGDRR